MRSYSFGVLNGTRQGAVFSPRGGFNSYLDVLIEALINSGEGVKLGLHWYGSLFWANDGILLSTFVQGLQKMVNICQSHAAETDLMFSTDPDPRLSKTICICFNGKTENLPSIYLNNDPLPWKDCIKTCWCQVTVQWNHGAGSETETSNVHPEMHGTESRI